MRLRTSLLWMLLLVAGIAAVGLRLGRATPTEAAAERVAAQDKTAYTLPAAKLRKAVALDRTGRTLTVVETVWSVGELALLLWIGAVARWRDVAVRLSPRRWVQGPVFVLGLLLMVALLNLPLGIYGHTVARHYGLSVQGWVSWLGDRAKMVGLEWLIGSLLMLGLGWIIRKSPTRWWFWFWIPAAACTIAGVFVAPYVIDPLFNQFEPLSRSNPALVQQLERVVARGGLAIPPQRMFLMKASAKSTEMNAYVTGFGASKRVVVWDTSVAKQKPDEILFMFAHEMGHYALGHVALGVALSCIALLPLFWVGYHGLHWLLRRYGEAWHIRSQQDWGAMVVLAMVLLTASILSDPLDNAVSRAMEHDADVYGQEAVHGIVGDPQAVGQQMFQELGENSLDDPAPHRLFEWWFDTHPTTEFRAAFAKAYDPWVAGAEPKYFRR